MRRWSAFVTACSLLAVVHGMAVAQGAVQLREQGNVQHAIDVSRAALLQAQTPREQAIAEGELGISQLQARDFAAAKLSLDKAYRYFAGRERAPYAIYLGNLHARRKLAADARRYYDEALALAGQDEKLAFNARLNLASLAPAPQQPVRLQQLSRELMAAPVAGKIPAFHLNLAHQAWQMQPPDVHLAYTHLERARQLAHAQGRHRLSIEADDMLASMYEQLGRHDEALTITRAALAQVPQASPVQMADLVIALEWRQARLLGRHGVSAAALAAFERATSRLQANRDDIPLDYDNGRSSLRETIAPLYLGYAAMLLAQADLQGAEQRGPLLRRVLDAVEQIRQAELQDYLGDRCAVEAQQGGRVPSPGVAILYPIIFPDRLELLLETNEGIVRRTTPIDSATLLVASNQLAFALRNGLSSFMAPSRQLYDWLLRPFDQLWTEAHIDTLVLVPDGALRMLPLAVLHDGERYAIQKFAVATVIGMSMTSAVPVNLRHAEALVVGVSSPGPVVDKLRGRLADKILQAGSGQTADGLASARSLRSMTRGAAASDKVVEQLRASLALPGVALEVNALAGVLPGTHLLNAQFTVDRFRRESGHGGYRILHIASHGVFGGNAESSFILAYDDLLTMSGLQAILKSDEFLRTPVELLSLSACETAEGNERAPLGMSGVAIKARAKSVLGTLWALEDNAAQQVMTRFYQGWTRQGLGKAQSLRAAQLALLADPETAHPFFWAPFILIGNWQ